MEGLLTQATMKTPPTYQERWSESSTARTGMSAPAPAPAPSPAPHMAPTWKVARLFVQSIWDFALDIWATQNEAASSN